MSIAGLSKRAAVRPRVARLAACVAAVLAMHGSADAADSTQTALPPPTAAGSAAAPNASADEHPRIALARRYRQAVADADVERVAAMQAPDARVWFDQRQGDGRPLDARGKGPWAAWDRFFRARSQQEDFVVVEDAVRFTNHEINDWFRLVERTPLPYYIYYYFNDENRITGKLIQAIEGQKRASDRLDEFRAWASDKHPGLIEHLMPNGNIDPSLDKARLWKERLLEWRGDTGLPNVLDDRN